MPKSSSLAVQQWLMMRTLVFRDEPVMLEMVGKVKDDVAETCHQYVIFAS